MELPDGGVEITVGAVVAADVAGRASIGAAVVLLGTPAFYVWRARSRRTAPGDGVSLHSPT